MRSTIELSLIVHALLGYGVIYISWLLKTALQGILLCIILWHFCLFFGWILKSQTAGSCGGFMFSILRTQQVLFSLKIDPKYKSPSSAQRFLLPSMFVPAFMVSGLFDVSVSDSWEVCSPVLLIAGSSLGPPCSSVASKTKCVSHSSYSSVCLM